jgi:hypothetical protein
VWTAAQSRRPRRQARGVPMQYFASFGSFTARDETQSIVLKAGQETSITGEIPVLVHLDKRHDAALAFKLTTTGTIKLTVTINDNPLLDQQFESPEPDSVMRVWHAIIHGRNLKRRNNRLNITASNGTGQVELSDFVLSYHAKHRRKPTLSARE